MPLPQRPGQQRLMGLLPRDECLHVADAVLAHLPEGCEGEVVVDELDSALTRFAHNAVHQNVAEQGTSLRLRLVDAQRRVGVAQVRGTAADRAERLVRAADRARLLSPPGSARAPLAQPVVAGDDHAAWSDATAAATPEWRADAVGRIATLARDRGLSSFGALSTTARQMAVVNSRGVRRCARATMAQCTTVVRGEDGSGFAERAAAAVDDLDVDGIAAEVVETAQRNQGAQPLTPGVYPVVLSPYAVAEMIEYLSYMAFGALARQEGRSFMRPGERLMSETVGIRDDVTDARVLPFPFDWEGVTTRRVDHVRGGVCGDLVYDLPTALVDGVESTGHSLPQPNTEGPQCSHLVVDAGSASADDLLDGAPAVYVTRFWYVREVHALRTMITGMTREGTFLVEGGRLSRPVKDMRFTQSIVDALATVEGIAAERMLRTSEDGVSLLVPAMRLGRFAFTS